MSNNKKCKTCLKSFYTSKGKETCRSCSKSLGIRREPRPNEPVCKNCFKNFYSTRGKEFCRKCSLSLGLVSREAIRQLTKRRLLSLCEDIKIYEPEIKCLAVKLKYRMISPLDIYRIADLYMKITCNEIKYSTKEPLDQCYSMIDELLQTLMSLDQPKHPRSGKSVVVLDKNNKIKAEYPSVRQAAKALDYSEISITRLCDGKPVKCIKENIKWKASLNI